MALSGVFWYITYLESDLYKAAVTDIAKGEPDIEIYIITASLTDGVVL